MDTLVVAPALTARYGKGADSSVSDAIVPTLRAAMGGGTTGHHWEAATIAFMWQAGGKNDASGAYEHDFTPTMPSNQTVAVAYPLAMRGRDQGAELEMGDPDVYNALRAGDGGSSRANHVLAPVAYRKAQKAHDPDDCERWEQADAIDTLAGHGTTTAQAVVNGMAVRRLMPIECERLQGFPDGWTEPETDSARYRLLGNAVCVPVAEWIGRRIVEAV